MKKIRVSVAGLLAMTLMMAVPFCAWAVPDVDPFVKIHDFTGNLGEPQIEELGAEAQSIIDEFGIDIVLVLTNDTEDATTRNYANDFYDSNNFGMGVDRDGLLLLLNLQASEVYIATNGLGVDYFNDAYLSYMLDGIAASFANQDYYGAASGYLYYTQAQLERIREDPSRIGSRNIEEIASEVDPIVAPSSSGFSFGGAGTAGNALRSGLFALVLALVAAGILIVLQRSGAPVASDAGRVYLEGDVSVTNKQDVFLRTNTTRSPLNKDAGASGGGSKKAGSTKQPAGEVAGDSKES